MEPGPSPGDWLFPVPVETGWSGFYLSRWRPATGIGLASSQDSLDCADCIVRLDTPVKDLLTMTATFSLFERWKAAKGYDTDSAAANQLGVTRAAVSLWRQGRNGSASLIERMAKDLGEDAVPVILQAFAEAARDAEDKRTLGRLAKRLGAACVALLALAPWTQPASAQERVGTQEAVQLIHYAQWLTVRLRQFRAWCRPFGVQPPCNPLASYLANRSTRARADSTKRKSSVMWTCPQIGQAGGFAAAG